MAEKKYSVRTKAYAGAPVFLRSRSGHRVTVTEPRTVEIHPEIVTVLHRPDNLPDLDWLVIEVSTGGVLGEGKTRGEAVAAAKITLARHFGEKLGTAGTVQQYLASQRTALPLGPVIPDNVLESVFA